MRRIAVMLAVWFTACAAPAADPAGDPPDLYIAPYLQNVTPDGITVMWETTEPVVGTVEFGAGGSFRGRATEPEPRTIHEVHIAGLEASTKYDYRVRYADRILAPASFTTAPPPGTPSYRFVVYGDNRSNPDTHARNVSQIMALGPAFVLNTGDLVAAGSEYEQWKEQYFDPLRGLFEYVPLFPCLGNHEQNAEHYYNYHSLPDEQGEVYYSFDYGNAHIIALNSNEQDAPFDLGEAQTEWLIADLEAHRDATWKFVFFHHPLFRAHATRGIHAQRWVWQPIFEQYGVDVVFAGHDHHYMRSYAVGKYAEDPKRGVYHLVSGGGGAPTYPMAQKAHAASRRRVHHVMVIDVLGDRLVGRGVDIDGNVFDAFVVDKAAAISPEESIAYEVFELERDLGEAMRALPVVSSAGERLDITQEIEVPNPFDVPLWTTFAWKGTNGWTVTPQRESYLLEPGTPLKIAINARGPAVEFYPVPTATLRFQTPEGEKAFRNDVVEFYPS